MSGAAVTVETRSPRWDALASAVWIYVRARLREE